MNFEFKYHSTYPEAEGEFPNETTITKAVKFDYSTSWDKVLDEFVSFLGSCYGYDISDKVKYTTLFDRMEELSEDYPDAFNDEDESTEGREFR